MQQHMLVQALVLTRRCWQQRQQWGLLQTLGVVLMLALQKQQTCGVMCPSRSCWGCRWVSVAVQLCWFLMATHRPEGFVM
jgi:hypothetical protein